MGVQIKVIKNVSRKDVELIFRGRKISMPAKHSMILNEKDEGEKALYNFLTQTCDYIIDISTRFMELN